MFSPYLPGELRNVQFYMIPKSLFKNPLYKDLSITAKVLYAFLFDRLELSMQNKWFDENGVYIIYKRESLAEELDLAINTVTKCFKELIEHNLIQEVKEEFSKPKKIYVGKVEIDYNPIIAKSESHNRKFCESYSQNFPSNNTNTSNTNKNDITSSKEEGRSPVCQTTLINMPEKEDVKPSANEHKKLAQWKIRQAKKGSISWNDLTARDFTYYFIDRHNSALKTALLFDKYDSVPVIRDCFINRYSIPQDKVCDYMDEFIRQYSELPNKDNWEGITYGMLKNNKPLVDKLMRLVKEELEPVQRKYDYSGGRAGQSREIDYSSEEVF